MINGYKCFYQGLTDNFGNKYEIGKTYHVDGEIKFGDRGNGFHICTNLEDTLRYFDTMNNEVEIAIVTCFGKTHKNNDEYNGYYDMYSCEYMIIDKILKREEIINYGLDLDNEHVKRFVSQFKLTKEEILLFKEKFKKEEIVLDLIAYYQENDKGVFKRKKI